MTDLWTTAYGNVVLVKAALFCLIVTLGAINRLRLLPQLGSATGLVATRMRVLVTTELALTMMAILAAAILGQMAPPASGAG